MQQFDVIGVGVNTVDALYCLPAEFQVDGKNPTTDVVVQGGGPAGTASCVCAMFGWRTGLVTPMGQNMLSQVARLDYVSRGICPDLFVPYENACPCSSVIQIDPRMATRTIFYTMDGYQHLDPADLPFDVLQQAKVVIADCYEPAAAMTAVEALQGTACRSVLDLEVGDTEWLWRMIALGTDVILPLAAARRLTGASHPADVLRALAAQSSAHLVVTHGTEGSWALLPDGVYHQPAFAVAAKDTTGCGDVFHGAYAAGLLEGMPPVLRLEFAAWMASLTATQVGGRAALCSKQELAGHDQSRLSGDLRGLLATWNQE